MITGISKTYVGPKNRQLWLRLAAILTIVTLYSIGLGAFIRSESYVSLAFGVIFFVLIVCELSNGLFLRPIAVQMNSAGITADFFAARFKFIKVNEIAGYSDTLFSAGIRSYKGVLLYLKDGSKIEVCEFNTHSIQPVQHYLNNLQEVTYFGVERSHFGVIPFQYQYNPGRA
jgi:hypothetical protein